jgi:riboflavin kinase/FMN adenylyltransferase
VIGLLPTSVIIGDVVSTSLIRKNILQGNVKRACELLARPYPISGVVIDGAKRGRQLGFPTINLKYPLHRVLPKEGVYVTQVEIDNYFYLGVCNVGFNPTFSQDHQVKIECYILDFDRDVYHKNVTLHFLDRLRDEKRFSSRESLVSAIEKDIAAARRIILPLPNG